MRRAGGSVRMGRLGRTGVASAAIAAVLATTYASAASLGGASSPAVGAGAAAIASCDSSFTIDYTTSHGDVTAVTVGDIADPACEGGEVRVSVVSAAGAEIASGGPGTVPSDGDTSPGSATIAVVPNPAAEQVATAHVSVVGP